MSKYVDFVHLHLHTQYSLLDGACKITDLMDRAVKLGFPAIAMTDHGNMFGAIDFYSEAIKRGIKPIIGMEAYLAPVSRTQKTNQGISHAGFHLVLLAKNEAGYKNLMKLSSIGYLEGFHYKPRIDKEVLAEYSDGLVGLSACVKGEIPYYLVNNQYEKAKDVLGAYIDIFGKENFFLELQDHDLPDQKLANRELLKLHKDTGIKLVATNDVHYILRKNAEVHDALLCIQTGTTLDNPNRMRMTTPEFYLKSYDEMESLFSSYPDALKNTLLIAEMCNLEIELGRTLLPYFAVPESYSHQDYLKKLCIDGLKKRFKSGIPEEYTERLEYELGVINKMGYTDYFLIVWDFIRFAKEKGIAVGPGRGSAAGSLVAYSLGITDVDPLKFNLLFERFLNPARVSMPDIDIDFCKERRGEVIKYVAEKYGEENVSQIITFQSMKAKGVIRDVGRVMGISYTEVDKIAKLIPNELDITIEKALSKEPRLKDAMKSDPRIADLIETARELEGLNRNPGVHAAGVVISDKPISAYVPLCKSNDVISTQYSMKVLEKIGLLKMDFLGLRTLTIINEALRIINGTEGIDIDISAIPFDDPPTYELFSKGETIGVFQLESSGMRDILRKLKPQKFDDVAALLALYRPGPLGSGMVDDFIQRKNGLAEIKYDHPLLEPILKETYGIILYQEQVMKIVSSLAGFTLAQADLLRRAIGKKIPEVLAEQRKNFIEGAVKNNVKKDIAKKIFDQIEYFAGYGFNKSHSVAYSFISYQTAYLKANYPLQFMTAMLTLEKDDTDKVVKYIDEAKRLGFKILPPSVNESESEFICSKKDKSIRFGLSAIKNVGESAIDSIIATRNKIGPFKSIYHFVEHVDLRAVNRKVVESLIKSGAFDCFSINRASLMASLDHLLEIGNKLQRDKESGQLSFFDTLEEESEFGNEVRNIPIIDEWSEGSLLSYEKDVLGFYISSHPLAKWENILKEYGNVDSENLAAMHDQTPVRMGGIIDSVTFKITKRGDRMAFLSLEDMKGKIEVIVFPDTFRKTEEIIKDDELIFVSGKANTREDRPKIIAENIMPLKDVRRSYTKVITINLKSVGLTYKDMEKLKEIIENHKGNIPVYINLIDKNGKVTQLILGSDYSVRINDILFREIENVFGEDTVKVGLP